MARRKPRHLVAQYVESLPRTVLEDYQDLIREYVRGRHGIYALYRRDQLYYVGLASNLRSRLRAHVRDRHSQGWDRFSLYLTMSDGHLRELEALSIRIAAPRGNRSKTRFPRAQDLRPTFRRQVIERNRRELEKLFGHLRPVERTSSQARGKELARLISGRLPIRMKYKSVVYKATARADGTIQFKGEVFTSPSNAAAAITRRPTNGWWWWRYQRTPGRWVRLSELRA